MTVKPADLLPSMPFLPNTFGKFELEFAAVLVILWHIDNGHDDWTPIDCQSIVAWVFASEIPLVVELRTNPFARPYFAGLRNGGFVDGWAKSDEPGAFSALGLKRLERLVEGQKRRDIARHA